MTALIVICATAIFLGLLNKSVEAPPDDLEEEYIVLKRKPSK